MPTHNASPYISICAAPVVDSPRVNFTLGNVFPLFGPSMRVSRLDVFGLSLLMSGQAGKTLTLAYRYEPILSLFTSAETLCNSAFQKKKTCAIFFIFSASIFGTYSGYRAPASYIIYPGTICFLVEE
jgi:hypothetical protein